MILDKRLGGLALVYRLHNVRVNSSVVLLSFPVLFDACSTASHQSAFLAGSKDKGEKAVPFKLLMIFLRK